MYFQLEKRPTAVFTLNDLTAFGLIHELNKLGLKVPEDISVVGYDGIVIGQYSLPRLTTVRQDTQQLAERGGGRSPSEHPAPEPPCARAGSLPSD